jgi:hypothetical protein
MGNTVTDYQAKPPKVTGVITINHERRLEMNLSLLEYVLMDAIVQLKEKKHPVTVSSIYILTGLAPSDQQLALKWLIEKGYVYPAMEEDNSPKISDKWQSYFKSLAVEFEDFWNKDGKVCWPGSKIKAQSLYVALRKLHSKDFLIQQRNEYFRYLELLLKSQRFDRPKMMATVFLGPQERFKESWTAYCSAEEEKIKRDNNIPDAAEDIPSTKTKADRLKKYED